MPSYYSPTLKPYLWVAETHEYLHDLGVDKEEIYQKYIFLKTKGEC